MMIPLAFVYDLCDVDDYSDREWAIYGNSCERQPADRSWFIFRPYAAPIVVLIVLFWHPTFSWFYRHQRYFLDKFSIHQSDVTGQMPQGINRLPLFLQKSKVLYSLFDSKYTTRMWCVWELAVYLRTRPDPEIVFTSVTMRMIEIVVIVVSILCNLMVDVTEDLTESDLIQALAR